MITVTTPEQVTDFTCQLKGDFSTTAVIWFSATPVLCNSAGSLMALSLFWFIDINIKLF